jgi:hypothetical protein
MGEETGSRSKRILKKSAIAVGALLVGVLLAELGLRLALRMQGKAFDDQASRVRIRAALSPISSFVPANVGIDLPDGTRRPVLNPFYGSEENPDTGDVLKHFREDARPDDFVVLLLGGSVAAYLGLTEGKAIVADLEKRESLRGRRVVFLNGAHAAHKQPQQVTRLALLLAFGYRPDLVLVVDGFNETALASENADGRLNPLWPSAPAWSAVVARVNFASTERMQLLVQLWALRDDLQDLVDTTRMLRLDKTALGSKYVLSRLEALSRERNRLQAELQKHGPLGETEERELRQQGGPVFSGDAQAVLDFAVRGWSESSRSVRALCESRGIAYVHCIQPALFDSGSKPFSPEEQKIENPSDSWLRGARDGFPMLRVAGAQLAAQGESVIDATGVFSGVEETLYFDPCHFGPRGNELLREFILTRLPVEAVVKR